MRYRSDLLAVLSIVANATPALADDAERLFDEARELLRSGKTADACDRFAASVQRFEGRGVARLTAAAMINLADCREQNHQLATAWSTFLATATFAQNNAVVSVAAEARKRAGLLQPRLSTLTIAVPDANRIENLAITKNGQPIDTALWNQSTPLDGGTFVITASAPQNAMWSSTIEVPVELGRLTVEVPRLKQMSDLAPSVVVSTQAATPVVLEPVERRDETFSMLQWTGIGVAAVGAFGLGAGVYFGLRARSIDREARAWESFMPERFAEGKDTERTSIIALSAGGACVVAGGVLFYLGYRSRDAEASQIAVVPTTTGLGVVARRSF